MPSPQQKEILQNPESFATTLLLVVADVFGTEPDPSVDASAKDILHWDPETIRMEVDQEFHIKLSNCNYNKLMAAIEIVTSDSFYVDLMSFMRLCSSLYDGTFDPESFVPNDSGEVAWGITEALLLWPPNPQDEHPFSQDIVHYIGQVTREEGIMAPPDILRLGIRDDDPWKKVQGQYSDDPDMFNAIFQTEKSKTHEIDRMVKDRLRQLLNQLTQAHIPNGDVQGIAQRLLGSLQRATRSENSVLPDM